MTRAGLFTEFCKGFCFRDIHYMAIVVRCLVLDCRELICLNLLIFKKNGLKLNKLDWAVRTVSFQSTIFFVFLDISQNIWIFSFKILKVA